MADDPNTGLVKEDPAIDSLEQRIARARDTENERLAREHSPLRSEGQTIGMKVASTMVGYPLGGIVIGWGLDELFGTRPWIMIVLMFMAFAGACLQVVRDHQNRQI